MNRAWSVVETVLRRYPWAVTLAMLVPCAYFDAVGVNHLLAQSIFKADTAALARPAPLTQAQRDAAAKPPPSFRNRDMEAILRRNVFDSAAGSLLPSSAPTGQPATTQPTPTQTASQPLAPGQKPLPEPCDTPAKVLGAIESERPEWSMLLVSVGTANSPPMLRRVGQVLENKPIREIGWHPRVGAYALFWVEETGPRCYLAQFMPPRPPPTAPTAPTPAPGAAPAAGDPLVTILDRVQPTGPNEFAATRTVVDELLKNQHLFMRQMRVNPVMGPDGRVTGLQMYGVMGNSLLGKLGMQQGDVLSRINGLEISSPDKALEAYSRLRTSDRITLSLTRNNQPMTIDINIK